MKTSFKQQGLSSVEMVMILPFFLFFLLLIANVGKFWHAKLDNLVAARTEAWREAMFDSLPDELMLCDEIEERVEELRDTGRLGPLFSAESVRQAANKGLAPVGRSLACKGNTDKDGAEFRGTNVLKVAASSKNLNPDAKRYRTGFISELNKTGVQPYATTGRSYYLWGDWLFKDRGIVLLEDYHVLDVNGSWQRQDIPLGHDDYIDKFLIQP